MAGVNKGRLGSWKTTIHSRLYLQHHAQCLKYVEASLVLQRGY